VTKRDSGKRTKRGKSSAANTMPKRASVRIALQDAQARIKTAEAELEALRQRARELERMADAAEQEPSLSKREVAKAAAWVAPIVLAVNLPNSVFAAPAVSPVSSPTTAPTTAPTSAPTAAPTRAPTTAPTSAPTRAPTTAPTSAPTAAPTRAPTAPTAAPTASPTSAPTTAPSGAPTPAGP
jgi:hypothetical protein